MPRAFGRLARGGDGVAMDAWTFARRSFVHHWRVNLAVIFGAAIATAVIAGALIVGDSVRGSLLDLTIQRLGRIDEIVLADRFFRQELADSMIERPPLGDYFTDAVPAIVLPTTSAEHIVESGASRASSVTLVGCGRKFWEQDIQRNVTDRVLDDESIIINQPLADQLRVSVGDTVTLRLPKIQNIASDSTLADKSDLSETLAGLKVRQIVPAKGLGRFSLNPSQHLPLCAFVSLETAQDALDRPGYVNTILVCSDRINRSPPPAAHAAVVDALRPTLDDAGLVLKKVQLQYLDERSEGDRTDGALTTAHEYLSLSTDRMMFVQPASDALESNLAGVTVQPVLTYLANSIATMDGSVNIPYSTITAIDSNESIGPLFDSAGDPIPPLEDDEIVLNSWAANDLSVSVNDRVSVSYFDPETTHGETTEHTETFRVAAIVPLVKPLLPYTRRKAARYVDPPAWTNDPDLTPTVEGMTDQASIDDWDPPFPFDYKRIQERKPKDDDYWASYRTTPKAFVSLKTGQRIWGSRFGAVTSYRIDPSSQSLDSIRESIEAIVAANSASFGFQVIESKRRGIEAAKGTTPFNVLFFLFSLFIVTAAVLLVALLFRLNIEQRSEESGLLLSVGLGTRTTGKLILFEGMCLSFVAAVLGVGFGIGYAALMITGLKTWWVDAVVTPFLELHVSPWSLVAGAFLGIVTTCLTICITLWGLRKVTTRQLLSGVIDSNQWQAARNARDWKRFLPAGFFAIAIATAILGTRLSGESQAGAFFGTGASVLIAGLLIVRSALWRSMATSVKETPARFSELILAMKNASQNPSRSVMTIGLMASACFLIIAISAFRLAPSEEGTGGFALTATSELPIFDDLNDVGKRDALFGQAATQLDGATILSLRLQGGEDASCRNLYQTQRPRLIGVTPKAIEYFEGRKGFKFAGTSTADENAWQVLAEPTPKGKPIPVVLDKNTAMYSQHLYGGIGEEFERDYGGGRVVRFRVAGLLANSILQGSLLIGEADMQRLFTDISGYRYFLIESDNPEKARALLEDTFQNEGLDATDTEVLLRDLLSVQNTYLSTFQSLGGLGLLLGTFGLMAVQLRNVWQRRGEIALLRATGFDQSRIGRIILLEHAFLLFSGLGIGIIAALLTVLPHIVIGGASIPLSATLMMLLLIMIVGLVTGLVAVRASSKLPLLKTLRGS